MKKNKKVQIAYKENRMSPSTLDRRRVRAGAPSPHLTSPHLTSPVMLTAKRCSSIASSFLSSIITYLP